MSSECAAVAALSPVGTGQAPWTSAEAEALHTHGSHQTAPSADRYREVGDVTGRPPGLSDGSAPGLSFQNLFAYGTLSVVTMWRWLLSDIHWAPL